MKLKHLFKFSLNLGRDKIYNNKIFNNFVLALPYAEIVIDVYVSL